MKKIDTLNDFFYVKYRQNLNASFSSISAFWLDVERHVIYWLTSCWFRGTSWYFVLASRSLCV